MKVELFRLPKILSEKANDVFNKSFRFANMCDCNYTDEKINNCEIVPFRIEDISEFEQNECLIDYYTEASGEAISKKFQKDILSEVINKNIPIDIDKHNFGKFTISKILELKSEYEKLAIDKDNCNFLILSEKALSQLKADMREKGYKPDEVSEDLIKFGVIFTIHGFHIIKSKQIHITDINGTKFNHNIAFHKSAIKLNIQKDMLVIIKNSLGLEEESNVIFKKEYDFEIIKPEAIFEIITI